MIDFLIGFSAAFAVECNTELSGSSEYVSVNSWPYRVCQKLQNDYDKVAFTILNSKLDNRIHRETTIKSLTLSEIRGGRLKVGVAFDQKNQEQKVEYFLLSVETFKSVYTFARNLEAGSVIQEADIKLDQRNVAPFTGARQWAVSPPVGKKVVSRMRAGQILFEDLLARSPLIVRNERLKAVFEQGLVRISMDATAITEAYQLGESIKIKIENSAEIYTGELRENKVVYVRN